MSRIFLLILLQINIAFISYGMPEPVNVPSHINFITQLEVSNQVGVEALSQRNLHRDPIRGGVIVNNNPLGYTDPLGLEPGDIYVYKNNNSIQNVIGAATKNGDAGHVAIEVKGGGLLTARPGEGVSIDAADSVKNQNVDVYRPNKKVDVKWLQKFAKDAIGKSYDYSAINGVQTNDGSEFTCSSCVDAASKAGGIDLGIKRKYGSTTPNDIANSSEIKLINQYKKKS